jgi:DNA-binding MarR family transcriptional regulator
VAQGLEAAGGISYDDYDVLLTLNEAVGRRLRMSDLARLTLLSHSGISRAVTRLESEGLLKRERCETDGRGFFAVLTKRGQKALKAAFTMLKPGGRIVVLDLLKHQFEKARDLYADVWLGFSESDLHEMLGKAGFKGIETSVVHRESNSPHFQTLLALAEKENRFTSTGHWSGS